MNIVKIFFINSQKNYRSILPEQNQPVSLFTNLEQSDIFEMQSTGLFLSKYIFNRAQPIAVISPSPLISPIVIGFPQIKYC